MLMLVLMLVLVLLLALLALLVLLVLLVAPVALVLLLLLLVVVVVMLLLLVMVLVVVLLTDGRSFFVVGADSLDSLLCKGLMLHHVVEVVGRSSSGKTQVRKVTVLAPRQVLEACFLHPQPETRCRHFLSRWARDERTFVDNFFTHVKGFGEVRDVGSFVPNRCGTRKQCVPNQGGRPSFARRLMPRKARRVD